LRTLFEIFFHPVQHEVIKALKELNCAHLHFEFVKKLITVAFDQTNFHRELASRLLSRLAGDVISTEQVAKAFAILLQRVEDTYLDVPAVLGLLSRFIARGVEDEALPPVFLLKQDLLTTDMGYQVICESQKLLKEKGSGKRMRYVWLAPKPKLNASESASCPTTTKQIVVVESTKSVPNQNADGKTESKEEKSKPVGEEVKSSRSSIGGDEDEDEDNEALTEVDLIDRVETMRSQTEIELDNSQKKK